MFIVQATDDTNFWSIAFNLLDNFKFHPTNNHFFNTDILFFSIAKAFFGISPIWIIYTGKICHKTAWAKATLGTGCTIEIVVCT